jgi:hypothetical protein
MNILYVIPLCCGPRNQHSDCSPFCLLHDLCTLGLWAFLPWKKNLFIQNSRLLYRSLKGQYRVMVFSLIQTHLGYRNKEPDFFFHLIPLWTEICSVLCLLAYSITKIRYMLSCMSLAILSSYSLCTHRFISRIFRVRQNPLPLLTLSSLYVAGGTLNFKKC